MKNKKLLLLAPCILLSMTSCARGGNIVQNNEEYDAFIKDYSIIQEAGADGILADLRKDNLNSTDDIIYLSSVKNVKETMELPHKIRGISIIGLKSPSAKGIFQNNEVIKKITLPSTYSYIGENTFNGATNLKDIIFDKSTLNYVGNNAFKGTIYLANQEELTLGNAIIKTKVNSDKFIINNNITNIHDNAIINPSLISSVTFSENIINIGAGNFKGSKLTNVMLPSSVVSVGEEAFANISNLTTIDFKNSDLKANVLKGSNNITEIKYNGYSTLSSLGLFVDSDGKAIDKNDYKLTSVTFNSTDELTSEEKETLSTSRKCEIIAASALANIPSLKKVTIGKSFSTINSGAFNNSVNVETIDGGTNIETLLDASLASTKYAQDLLNVNHIASIGKSLIKYTGDSTEFLSNDKYVSFAPNALENNQTLTKISLKGVKIIGNNAIKNVANLQTVEQTESLLSIGDYSFDGCSKLTSFEANNTESIGTRAFKNCKALKKFYIAGSTKISDYKGGIYKPREILLGCSSIEEVKGPTSNVYTDAKTGKLSYTESEFSFQNYFKEGDNKDYVDQKLTKFIVPFDAGVVADSMFYGISSLENIEFETKNTKVETSNGLVDFEVGVTYIGQYSFYDCESITSIELPNSVRTIKEKAFTNLTNLTSIKLSNRIGDIETAAFFNLPKLTEITIPASATLVAYKDFTTKPLHERSDGYGTYNLDADIIMECNSLKKITIEYYEGITMNSYNEPYADGDSFKYFSSYAFDFIKSQNKAGKIDTKFEYKAIQK